MSESNIDSPNTPFSLNNHLTAVPLSTGTNAVGKFLLMISDEDLRNPVPVDYNPHDWSGLKISDEDIRQQSKTMQSIGQNTGINIEQVDDYRDGNMAIANGKQNNDGVSIQNIIERRMVGILAMSDEDLRQPQISKNTSPQDWSWLKISDEDLR